MAGEGSADEPQCARPAGTRNADFNTESAFAAAPAREANQRTKNEDISSNIGGKINPSGKVLARFGEKISAPPAPHRTLINRLRYFWSFALAGLMLLIIAPPVLSISALAGRREWVYPFAHFGAKLWLRLSGVRVRVRGEENLVSNQTYIFISNHRSYLDTAALFHYAGRRRRIGLLAKKELLKVPILGYGMGFVNIMAIDRSNRERALATVRDATERIKSGVSFGVFAEGTRAQPGELLPFKKGAFHMAIDAKVPIVPVAMKNTDVLMGKGAGVLESGEIEIVFLPPIPTEGMTQDSDIAPLIERVRNEIKEELRKP